MSVRRRQALTSRCPSDLAPECAKTTITGASWMCRKHHIRWAGARLDRTSYLGGAETVIGVSDRFKPCEGRRGLHREGEGGGGRGGRRGGGGEEGGRGGGREGRGGGGRGGGEGGGGRGGGGGRRRGERGERGRRFPLEPGRVRAMHPGANASRSRGPIPHLHRVSQVDQPHRQIRVARRDGATS